MADAQLGGPLQGEGLAAHYHGGVLEMDKPSRAPLPRPDRAPWITRHVREIVLGNLALVAVSYRSAARGGEGANSK